MEHCHLPLHTLQPAAQLSPETWEPEDCLPLPTHIPGCTVLTFGVEGAEMLWKTGTQVPAGSTPEVVWANLPRQRGQPPEARTQSS